MSLTENDPPQFMWRWHPVVVGVFVALVVVGGLWIVDIGRYLHDTTRAPWGLGIFRWDSNYLGEAFFLPIAIGLLAAYYQRVQVESSFWTSKGFFAICWITALAYVILFVAFENNSPDFPPGERLNANRVWHFLYSIPLWAMTFGGIRLFGYGLWSGRERGLAFGVLIFVLLFFATVLADMREFNPVLDYLDTIPKFHGRVRVR